MLGRLKRNGFTEATRVGRVIGGPDKGKTIVRALDPAHGWAYEKIDETDEAASDAAVDAWAARVGEPVINPRNLRIGVVKP
jgi:hypothetical protein